MIDDFASYFEVTNRKNCLDKIRNDIIFYYGGSELPEQYTDEMREIIALANEEWETVKVDPEGPSFEQNQELEYIVLKASEKVYDVARNSLVKTAYIFSDTAEKIVLDDEIVSSSNGSLNFYAWATESLMEQFIPSAKRLSIDDEDNVFNFYFEYHDKDNLSLISSYYKTAENGKEFQVYETWKISPESEGFDKLIETLDDYCMEQAGCHLIDYKLVDPLKKVTAEEFSEYVNNKTQTLFPQETAGEILSWYSDTERPVYMDSDNNFYIYFRNQSDVYRDDESPVQRSSASGIIGNILEELDAGGNEIDAEYILLEKIHDELYQKENGKENAISLNLSNIPEWAVYYMAYGETDTLSEDERKLVDSWMKNKNVSSLAETTGEKYFSNHPAFGLACDCYDCVFIRSRNNTLDKSRVTEKHVELDNTESSHKQKRSTRKYPSRDDGRDSFGR